MRKLLRALGPAQRGIIAQPNEAEIDSVLARLIAYNKIRTGRNLNATQVLDDGIAGLMMVQAVDA